MKKNSESFTFLYLVLQSFTSLPNITVLDLKKWATKKLFSLFFFACKEWFSPQQFKNCKRYEKFSECLFIMKRKLIRYHTWQKQSPGVVLLKRLRPATLLKKRLWHRCFPVNFTKILRIPFLTEHLRWLLLDSTLNIFLKEFSLVKIEAAIHLRNFLSLSRMFQNNFLFRTLSSRNFCHNRSF